MHTSVLTVLEHEINDQSISINSKYIKNMIIVAKWMIIDMLIKSTQHIPDFLFYRHSKDSF